MMHAVTKSVSSSFFHLQKSLVDILSRFVYLKDINDRMNVNQ